KRVVYLLRDGRDAMVSYFHFEKSLHEDNGAFLKFVQKADLWPCKWYEHVERWLANPYQCQLITIRYEDLLENTARELRRFCEFVGIKATDERLAAVANRATFSKMQKKEIDQGWGDPWAKDKLFVRRGKAGSYKDEMPAEVLNVFLQQASSTLSK